MFSSPLGCVPPELVERSNAPAQKIPRSVVARRSLAPVPSRLYVLEERGWRTEAAGAGLRLPRSILANEIHRPRLGGAHASGAEAAFVMPVRELEDQDRHPQGQRPQPGCIHVLSAAGAVVPRSSSRSALPTRRHGVLPVAGLPRCWRIKIDLCSPTVAAVTQFVAAEAWGAMIVLC